LSAARSGGTTCRSLTCFKIQDAADVVSFDRAHENYWYASGEGRLAEARFCVKS
jgi:hypothetical protein